MAAPGECSPVLATAPPSRQGESHRLWVAHDDTGPKTRRPEPASATAARVLRIEGEAVLHMADALPADFDAAVDAILATRGRVILGGIGKSGHIARKISSTWPPPARHRPSSTRQRRATAIWG
jgi:hypothetical protein